MCQDSQRAVPEELQQRAKVTVTSEVPEGDLSGMVTAKVHKTCAGKTRSSGLIASPWW